MTLILKRRLQKLKNGQTIEIDMSMGMNYKDIYTDCKERIGQFVEIKVRTTIIDGEPMFCLTDICKALELTQPSKVKERLNKDGVNTIPTIDSLGRTQNALFINESNLYKTIFQSRKESAERFTDWVTSEVLPSLRRNGGYIVGQENMTPEQIMAAGLKAAESIIRQKDKEIERMKPKEVFADAVTASHTTILVGDLAKLIQQNGVEIGQKRLFAWMRKEGYLIKRKGTDWNMPTQKAMEMGLFKIKESTYLDGNGCNVTKKTPKVTGKGQQYFINKFLDARME